MRSTIRLKFIAFTFCIVLLVGGGISLYSVLQGRERISATFERNAREITTVISGSIVNDLYFLDIRSLRRGLESVRVNPDIRYTYVTDLEGLVLSDGTGENVLRNQKLSDSFSRDILLSKEWISRVEGDLLKVGGPVFLPDGARVGHLYVGFSLKHAHEIAHDTTRASLYITLICLGIGAFLAVVSSTTFTRPILSIVQASKEIGEGKLDVRLPIKRSDELGALASAINQMATGLSGNLERIRALREIDMAIASTLNLREVLNVLLEKIDLALPYAAATVRLFNKESGLLEPVACRNLDEKEWKEAGGKAGRGPANAVFESKAPVMISDVQTDPRVRDLEFFRRHGLVSYLGVPLVVKDEVLGVLSFYPKEEHRFSNEEVEFLTTLAGQAAIAIHNSQLYEEISASKTDLESINQRLERSEEIQQLLKELSQDITRLDIDSLLKNLTEKVRDLFKVDISDVRLIENGSRSIIGVSGIDVERLRIGSTGSGRGGSRWIVENRRPLVISDITKGRDLPMGETTHRIGIRGYLGVPLFSRRGEVIAILRVLTYRPRNFTEEEVGLLQQMANGAAIALENARLLEQIKTQAVELDKANKVKDEFLGFVSHELRTPLNAVLGYTTMVQDGMFGEISAEQEKILAKVLSCSDDLLSMIDGLLQATRIGAGAVKMETEEVALVPFLDELRLAYDIPLDKEVKLNWDYPSRLPVTKTDREKLKHILQNLINNAIKYTDRGNVDISVRVKEDGGQERWVEFKVSDTGVGIAKESLPLIFEMFRQVEGFKNGSRGGVGLGLHIVKRFAELLGGEIEVQSDPGKGSTFTVKIPLEELGEQVGSAGKPHSELGKVR